MIAYYRGRAYYKPTKRDIARAAARIRRSWPDDDPRLAGKKHPVAAAVEPVSTRLLAEAWRELNSSTEAV